MTRDEAIADAVRAFLFAPVGRARMDAFLAALAASGYAVVPVEVTEKMVAASDVLEWRIELNSKCEGRVDVHNIGACWAAMVAAAETGECRAEGRGGWLTILWSAWRGR